MKVNFSRVIEAAVVVADPLFRDGLIATMQNSGAFEIVSAGVCADDAVRIAIVNKPAIILLDTQMPGDSIIATRMIAQSSPTVKIAILTNSDDEGHIAHALMAGAAGYITKDATGPEFLHQIREIVVGTNTSNQALESGNLPPQMVHALTQREWQILAQVSRGLSNKEVARVLALSEKTVKHYMTCIMLKLHVRNRVEAVSITTGQSRNLETGST
jgi:DNA-binding NarL/FixJ family response regulator